MNSILQLSTNSNLSRGNTIDNYIQKVKDSIKSEIKKKEFPSSKVENKISLKVKKPDDENSQDSLSDSTQKLTSIVSEEDMCSSDNSECKSLKIAKNKKHCNRHKSKEDSNAEVHNKSEPK